MEKPLKIIIFDGSLKTTTFINRLAKGLARKHQVYIVGFGKSVARKVPGVTYKSLGSSEHLLHLLWQSFVIALNALFAKGKIISFFKIIGAILFLRKSLLKEYNFIQVISAIQPSILHVQWPSLLPWVEKLPNRERLKVILSQRGFQNNVRPFVEPNNFKYLQKMYPKLDGFHSVSKGMSQVGDLIYKNPSKIDHVVYSGFDLSALPFTESYTPNPTLSLLSIGRPHWIKGYSDGLRACALLKEKGFTFTYSIIGAEGNEELQYLVHDLDLTDEVKLLGKVSQQEVYQQMNAMDVLLFPSIKEGLPNVVVEAMALGLPVISTNCGGVEELLSNGCGTIVPVREPEAICDAIVGFSKMTTSEIYEQRKKARKKVEQQHQQDAMVAHMEALYVKCLESSLD